MRVCAAPICFIFAAVVRLRRSQKWPKCADEVDFNHDDDVDNGGQHRIGK